MTMTPEQFADKQARRLKGAIEDMRSGIEGVTEAPSKLAVAKENKFKARLNEAIAQGKWKAGLEKVSLEEWKAKMIDKGLGRVSSGIDSAKDKVVDFASQLLPAVKTATDKIKGMPDVTLEDSIARMTAFTREMSKFRKK